MPPTTTVPAFTGGAAVVAADSGLVYSAAKDNTHNVFAAIKKGDLARVKEIVNRVDYVSELGMWSSTTLIVATQYGLSAIAHFLLDKGLDDVNHCNDKGM